MTRDEWQPIETAPKDGTRFDAWTREGRVPDVWWDAQRGEWVEWGLLEFGGVGARRPLWPPTHWMPIPEGPKDDEGN